MKNVVNESLSFNIKNNIDNEQQFSEMDEFLNNSANIGELISDYPLTTYQKKKYTEIQVYAYKTKNKNGI